MCFWMTEGVEIPLLGLWGVVRHTARHQNQRYVFHLGFGHRYLHVMSSLKGAPSVGWMEQWIIPYLQHPEIHIASTCFGFMDFSMTFLKSRFKMHFSCTKRLKVPVNWLVVAGAFNSGRKAFVNGRMRYISRVRHLDSASHWKHSIRVVSNQPSSDLVILVC